MQLTSLKTWSIAFALTVLTVDAVRAADPLPSWNEGVAKHAIVDLRAHLNKNRRL